MRVISMILGDEEIARVEEGVFKNIVEPACKWKGVPNTLFKTWYEDCFYGEGVCLIEWANLIEEILPREYRQITIEKDLSKGFDYRRITIEEHSMPICGTHDAGGGKSES